MNNRIIKFRAWEKEEKEMKEVHCLTFDFPKGGTYSADNLNSYWYEQPNIVLMQFTGLLDKNGKEIYEGDLVKIGDRVQECRFTNGRFKFFSNAGLIHKDAKKCEVIGNIYENPELLTPNLIKEIYGITKF